MLLHRYVSLTQPLKKVVPNVNTSCLHQDFLNLDYIKYCWLNQTRLRRALFFLQTYRLIQL